ncbi:MAG: hypothetical protein IJ654_03745 [Bacteroidales bacterium]|nr:hypothetical protein [Bacteroidales bacterium]
MSNLMILLQAVTVADTTQVVRTVQDVSPATFGSVVDIAYKLSMVAIAAFNILYVIKLNKAQNLDKEEQRESERRMDLLKTIVLIPNLKKMYRFLDKLWTELEKLKLENDVDKNADKEEAVKKGIEPKIQALFALFRSDFIIALNATTPSLGKKVEEISDTMRDSLLSNMADEGVNLWVLKYFNDKIKSVYENGKMDMVNALFNYKGES